MKPKEVWIEFGGDPSDDKEIYKRYSATVPFEPADHSDEVIHLIEYSAYEAIKKNQTAYRTFEAIAGDCKEKADMQDEIDALRAERDDYRDLIKRIANGEAGYFNMGLCQKVLLKYNNVPNNKESL